MWMRQLSVRVSDELYTRIERTARDERRTPSNYVRNLLADALGVRAERQAILMENFIRDVAAELGDNIATDFETAIRAIDIEADGNNHAGAFLEAVTWIVGHRDKSVRDRIEMIDKLRNLKGYNVINMREFTGWS